MVVRTECRPDENGVLRCKRITQTYSQHPGEPMRSDYYEEDGLPDQFDSFQEMNSMLNSFMKDFGGNIMRHWGFGDLSHEIESDSYQGFPFRFGGPFPRNHTRYSPFPQNDYQKNDDIYDV